MSLNSTDLGRVAVVMGGDSSEREISLKTGKAILAALKDAGCSAEALDVHHLDRNYFIDSVKKSQADVLFLALHGGWGEDGTIQRICEEAGICYTGSDEKASALAMNKIRAKEVFQREGVPSPEYEVIRTEDIDSKRMSASTMKFPVVVKPPCEGSSVGIYIVEHPEDLKKKLQAASVYDTEILLERYIPGREITVGILNDQALPIIEIKPRTTFFDFTAKYQQGMTEYCVPAQIAVDLSRDIQALALKAFRVLGCRDFGRVDLMLGHQNEVYVLEINTIPGFTQTSLLPKAARAQGIAFPALCCRIVEMALRRAKPAV